MAGVRPGVLEVGARVLFDDVARTVVGMAGVLVHLADEHGAVLTVDVATLCSRGIVTTVGQAQRSSLTSMVVPGANAEAMERARWWEDHILEVLAGCRPGAEPGISNPDYDPVRRTLIQREQAKAAELAAAGHENVSARTLNRKRRRYQASGLAGLVDWRTERSHEAGARHDPRVVAAMRKAIAETSLASTRSIGFLRWRVEQILEAEHGAGVVAMPSRSAFYRLFDQLARGTHAIGSARSRRSQAAQPEAPFGVFTLTRPGELMQIDSTPLDVAVMLPEGVVGRVELAGLIDVATRTVTAAVLRPTTKSVDASLLLARTVTPEPMRRGWVQALSMARSVLPHRHMVEIDQRLALAAARPVIIPEVIVCDQGNVFVSDNFRASCRLLGIDFQPCHDASPTEKPHIEKMMFTVSSLFGQYVSGYLGSSVERRGLRPEEAPLWSLMELQEHLEQWLVAAWQNRPHDGLRDPVTPGRMFTPNEKYASLVQAAGYVPLPLTAEDYVELLPAKWRAVNHYGVKIDHRTCDSDDPAFTQLRRQSSGDLEHKGLWEIHYDPYDVTRVWLRNLHAPEKGWITLFWKHLRSAPVPFGELAWDHALAQLRETGNRSSTEAEIAEAVAALLRRVNQGPASSDGTGPAVSRRDRRVVARTLATSPSIPDADVTAAAQPVGTEPVDPADDEDEGLDDPELAEVIPLAIFDAREEAKRWW